MKSLSFNSLFPVKKVDQLGKEIDTFLQSILIIKI